VHGDEFQQAIISALVLTKALLLPVHCDHQLGLEYKVG
jgi:hypothetical protein